MKVWKKGRRRREVDVVVVLSSGGGCWMATVTSIKNSLAASLTARPSGSSPKGG